MRAELLCVLRCPRCQSEIITRRVVSADRELMFACSSPGCAYGVAGFPNVAGKPALIDFDNSIMSRGSVANSAKDQAIETEPGAKENLRAWLMGGNDVGAQNCARLLKELRRRSPRPRVLVIGGGSRGAGTDVLYDDPNVEMVGTDIYDSSNIELLADGHNLPFASESFDGVVIQAVLEHVLDPPIVAAEIHRVLKPNGLLYAETPFMQQVHMAAYDFTRFTRSGHRWLFRNFNEIDAGVIGGPGLSLFWSIRYFIRSLVRSDKAATAISLPFFWLRFLDKFADARFSADGANGVYFIGVKSETALRPRQMVAYYSQMAAPAGVCLEEAWPSATTTKSLDSSAGRENRTSSPHSAGLPKSVIRTRTRATRPRSSASRK